METPDQCYTQTKLHGGAGRPSFPRQSFVCLGDAAASLSTARRSRCSSSGFGRFAVGSAADFSHEGFQTASSSFHSFNPGWTEQCLLLDSSNLQSAESIPTCDRLNICPGHFSQKCQVSFQLTSNYCVLEVVISFYQHGSFSFLFPRSSPHLSRILAFLWHF